jgi:hypothetical protein
MRATFAALMLLTTDCWAQSPLDGTWRPDPQRPGPSQQPDTFVLADGTYDCRTCSPPYRIKADGTDYPITGNAHYDSLRVEIIDARTIRKTARQGAKSVLEMTVFASTDHLHLTEQETLYGMGPAPLQITSQLRRVSAGPEGSHAISGTWKLIQSDLTNHDEDTVFELKDGVLTMSDRMGRSFAARVDGSDAPYNGSDEFSSVSVRLIDPRTIEESDKKDGKVLKVSRWSVAADGRTLHARFDDTHGHVQQQTGHKIR